MDERNTSQEDDRDLSLLGTLGFVACLFAAVGIFGLVADKIFDSESKAEEARKLGYDV